MEEETQRHIRRMRLETPAEKLKLASHHHI